MESEFKINDRNSDESYCMENAASPGKEPPDDKWLIRFPDLTAERMN
jgi:hypothetical protein